MSINAERFFAAKGKQFKYEAQHTGFKNSYLMAGNQVLQRLYIELNMTSAPSRMTNTETAIDLDADLEFVLHAGMDYHLTLLKGGKLQDAGLTELKGEYDRVVALALVHRQQDAAAAATDGATMALFDTDD